MLVDIFINIINGQAGVEYLAAMALIILGLLFSLSAHEFAHGYAAYRQGDGYAKCAGKLTLNPFKHLDPIGTLMLLLVGFGWAKPVPIVPANFKNGKKSMLIVAFAGVLCNLFLAFLLLNIEYFLQYICNVDFFSNIWLLVIKAAVDNIIFVNLTLCLFNLIPVPPLDGYRIMKEIFISYKNQRIFYNLERYSMIISVILIIFISRTGILGICVGAVDDLLRSLCGLIYGAYI